MAEEATGQALNGHGGELSYVRYKPGKDCIAQWSFAAALGNPVLVSAKMFRHGKGSEIVGRQAFLRLAEKASSAAQFQSSPYRYLPEHRVLLQVFPLDIRLPGAVLAASATWATDALSRNSALCDAQMDVTEALPLRYKAWHRLVLRYTVECPDGRLLYFAKVFRDDRGRAMFTRLRALKAQLAASGSPWDVPSPIAYFPAAHTLVLGDLGNGLEIKELLKDAVASPGSRRLADECVEKAAEGLAFLQRVELSGLQTITPHALLESLRRSMKSIASVSPVLAHSIELQLHALELEASSLPPEPLVPAHGAFRHTQMLVCGDKVGLVDWDGLRLSGASADAGEFLSCLDRMALRRPRLRSVLRHSEEVFAAALNGSLDSRWLRWYRAVENVKWALRSFVSLAAKGGEDTAEQLIALAQRTLARRVPRSRGGS